MNTSKRSHFITFTLMVAIFAIAISLFISIPGLLHAYVPSSDSSNGGASAVPSSDSSNGGASSGAPSSDSSNGGGAYVPSSDSSNGGASSGAPSSDSSNGGGAYVPSSDSSNGGSNPSSGGTPDTGSSNGGSTSSGPATPGTGSSNGGSNPSSGGTPDTGSSNGGSTSSGPATPGTGSSNGGGTTDTTTPGTGSSNGGSNPSSGGTPDTGSSNGGSTSSGPATPGTGSSNGGSNPSSGTTPSTGSSNGGSNTSGPATPGTGSSNGGSNPTSGGNTGGGTGGGSIPSGPGGAGTSGGGGNGPIVGSSYGGGGSIIFPPLPATSTPAAQAACVKLVNSLRLGASDNNPKDIRFLQTFLRDYERADVTVNGIFDQKTFKAVENFQIKYRADILSPWGASLPSGYVYITTKKKINEIYCGKAITLTSSENTTINNFKARRAAAKAAGIENAPDIDLSEIGINPSSTSTDLANAVNTMPTTSVATASSSNSRFIEATASAIRSVPRSVYNFFRNLFGGDEK